MPQGLRFATLAAVFVVLAGCSTAGVTPSGDPHQKLDEADALIEHNQPVSAEPLIVEALALCQSSGEPLCFADAYRTYGLFFMSPALMGQWKEHYVTQGFLEPSATYANRYRKALEYFDKARALYVHTEQLDVVSNLDLNRGFVYEVIADKRSACAAYTESLAANAENARLRPDMQIQVPAKYGSFANYIALQKRRAGCPAKG